MSIHLAMLEEGAENKISQISSSAHPVIHLHLSEIFLLPLRLKEKNLPRNGQNFPLTAALRAPQKVTAQNPPNTQKGKRERENRAAPDVWFSSFFPPPLLC